MSGDFVTVSDINVQFVLGVYCRDSRYSLNRLSVWVLICVHSLGVCMGIFSDVDIYICTVIVNYLFY